MRLVAAFVCAVALAGPATAGAQTNAPPGRSGIDEYVETIPTAGGNQVTLDSRLIGRPRVDAGTRRGLARFGSAGTDTARLAAFTAPAARRGGTSEREPVGGGLTGGDSTDVASRVPTSFGLVVAGSGGGMGLVFPALLLATLLAGIAVAIRRRRSPGSDAEA